MLNPWQGFETWANIAPEERQLLLNEIAARKIEGVVFISGDRHHSELNIMQRPGAYPLYEFTSSPLTASSPAPERITNLRQAVVCQLLRQGHAKLSRSCN